MIPGLGGITNSNRMAGRRRLGFRCCVHTRAKKRKGGDFLGKAPSSPLGQPIYSSSPFFSAITRTSLWRKNGKKKNLFFFVSFFLGWRDERRRMEVSSLFRPAAGGRSQSRSKRARAVKRSGNFWQQETLDLPQKTPIVKKCDFVREVCKFSA